MAKRINESPKITDKIIFDILTPDHNGCFLTDPHKVIDISIFFINRDFSRYYGEHEPLIGVPEMAMLEKYQQAKIDLCDDPTEENRQKLEELEVKLESSRIPPDLTRFYFASTRLVRTIGSENNPAWLSTDLDNALIQHITEDEEGNPLYGHFRVDWVPLGMREGDYFIQWSWQPLVVGSVLTTYQFFSLLGDTHITTSIPTHFTQEDKYESLLERYLPDMFKMTMTKGDLSPYVLDEFNKAVAKGFTLLEDMSNQSIDLIDANATPESLLSALANLFNLRLRSNDPTMWRRQIKRAVPLNKKKGTLRGLQEALIQAGIHLHHLSRLWQIKSNYTKQELFNVTDTDEFELSRSIIDPIDPDNIELYYRPHDEDEWQNLTEDYEDYIEFYGLPADRKSFRWKETAPINLESGDSIRILYEVAEIPIERQTLEEYIRSLPLADDRDERETDCPMKDWETRLIEDGDPLFDSIIPSRHPYHDPLMYGWIRTEFPFSENIYNMEEYNGSTRESFNPCHIDCHFFDPCQYCQSSKFNLYLEVENLSDDRLKEVHQIINEFIPFHASVNQINYQGALQDFMLSPVEKIQGLITYRGGETILSCPQLNFHRNLFDYLQLTREELANMELVANGSGVGHHDNVVLFSPYAILDNYSLRDNFVEVLSPHPNSGEYEISSIIDSHNAVISSISEPFDFSDFLFRISSELNSDMGDIHQDNIFTFKDDSIDFHRYGITTTSESLPAWKISFGGDDYDIERILPNGQLILEISNQSTSSQSNINYNLLDETSNPIISSNVGELSVTKRGRVDLDSISYDLRKVLEPNKNHYMYINGDKSDQYLIIGIIDSNQFYIDNYDDGDKSDVIITLIRRNVDNAVGRFVYRGETLVTPIDHEQSLDIRNGENNIGIPVLEKLKENYLVKIDSDYYAISKIDGVNISLLGPSKNWSLSGENVDYEIYRYTFTSHTFPETMRPNIPEHSFDYIDRSTGEIIQYEVETINPMLAVTLQNGAQIQDIVGQKESITYEIEYKEQND